MTPRHYLGTFAVASLIFVNGCRHNCKKGCNNPPPIGMPPGGIAAPPNLPPQGIPLDPPPRGAMRPELLLPDAANTPNTSRYAPMPSAPLVVLGDPELPTAKVVEEEVPGKQTPMESVPPPKAADEIQGGAFPVGIADFASVKEGIGSGLRPHLDGFDWLQANKYGAVLYLKRPTENDSSDRQQAEKHGMKYYSLTVSPEKLNIDLVKEFNGIVGNAADQPLFVYDHNGVQAGAMWYLYFRKVELLDDEQARIRAGKHGLKTTGNDEQIALWTAVQKVLSQP